MGVKRAVDDDPLASILAPPPNETPDEREARLRLEIEARQISDRIDEQLKAERAALKKNKPVKVLLLGQSESGKSTTLKNFQLTYCQDQWDVERASWRMVIQLNLIRGINSILDLITDELAAGPQPTPPSADSDVSDSDEDHNTSSRTGTLRGTGGTTSPRGGASPPLHLSGTHRLLKLRLVPLRTLQHDLEMRIGIQAGSDMSDAMVSPPGSPVMGASRKPQEFFVRSMQSWKGHQRGGSGGGGGGTGAMTDEAERRLRDAHMRETAEIIAGCAEDMKAIWEDPTVRDLLLRKNIRMETTPGFFLNDIQRIAARDYEPSDDDVVRARLRTLGVQEHRIKFTKGPAAGLEWCIYDVGGSRTQRMAWYPYFDDCDAIIFLAPISCFDERLAEDKRINRLEDSYMLWKAVVSSKLLAKTSIVLFLNKCDLLQQKLLGGVRIRDYVHSYGDRPNEVDAATKYFAQHFRDILRKNSVEPRPFRVHTTSVVDTRATALTLSTVQESLFKKNLVESDLV